MFEQRWEMNGIPNYVAGPADCMLMTNAFWAMRSPYFPHQNARAMVDAWALDRDAGLYSASFPRAMARHSIVAFKPDDDHAFGYTPDTAYFTFDGSPFPVSII